MPNRIIKESICTSEEIDALSPQAEILFYRLIVKADDYGLYFGNPKIIRSMCYPLKSSDIKDNQIKSWLDELVKCDLIRFYISEDSKTYLKLTKWERHQQIRAHKSKFPMPDSNGNQMISDDFNSPRNPIQSNPDENDNAISENDILSSEQSTDKKNCKLIYDDDSREMKLALLLSTEIKNNNPNWILRGGIQSWCDAFRLMLERDNRDYDDIVKMIKFTQWDEFWKTNILSPAKLRKQYDMLILKREEARKKIEQQRNR